jgi:KEOPS complex subunit Cgi121
MELIEGRAAVEDVERFVARLESIGERHGSTVQAVDARYVVGRDHLERAVALAERERGRGEAIADDLGVEILLYAAGRRQIREALEMGVSAGDHPVVVVVVGGDETAAAAAVRDRLTPAETLGEYDPETVADFFGIGERERAATAGGLPDLVGERVALLVVER